jgi:hypothetical protein
MIFKRNILAVKYALKEHVDTVLHTIQDDKLNLYIKVSEDVPRSHLFP